MMQKTPNNKGFTLIEIVVVMAILTFLTGFGLVMNLSYFKSDIFSTEQLTIVSTLQKARARAMNNTYETIHGVCFQTPNYILFRGRSTCSPNNSSDEIVPANENISTISNFSATFPTIIFSQLAGTSSPQTINITDGIKSTSIFVNSEGTIVW